MRNSRFCRHWFLALLCVCLLMSVLLFTSCQKTQDDPTPPADTGDGSGSDSPSQGGDGETDTHPVDIAAAKTNRATEVRQTITVTVGGGTVASEVRIYDIPAKTVTVTKKVLNPPTANEVWNESSESHALNGETPAALPFRGAAFTESGSQYRATFTREEYLSLFPDASTDISGEVTVTLTLSDGSVSAAAVKYNTAGGETVTIVTSYSYY